MKNNKKSIHNPKYRAMIDKIVELRRAHGLSQRDLAQMADVSNCFVGRMETCERRMDIIETIEILKILKLSKKEIIAFLEKMI